MAIAFFDIDHTIIPAHTAEKIFFLYLLKKGKISIANIFRVIIFFLKNIFFNPTKAILQNKRYLTNHDINSTIKLAADCFCKNIKNKISPEAINRINWHLQKNDKVVLLSGNLFFLADFMKDYLHCHDYIATQMQIKNNKFLGFINGLHPYHEAKKILLKQYIKEQLLEKEKVYCYADSIADVSFLACADYPFAVNASGALRKIAQENKWPLLNFPKPQKKITR